MATFDTSASSVASTSSGAKSSSNDIIDLFGSNGASSQPSNNLLTNQTSNLLFSSNQNGALHTQLNLNTINAGLLENGSNMNSSLSSNNLGFKPNSDLLGILANNSQSFHSNIFSQNHNIANTYQLNQTTATPNISYPSASSFNSLLVNQSPNNHFNSNSMQLNQSTPNTSHTIHNYQTMQSQQNLNINGNNLLMNPAFTTAASNPFASGFAQQPNTGGNLSSGATSNTSFEPNFANAFGSSSTNSSNGSGMF